MTLPFTFALDKYPGERIIVVYVTPNFSLGWLVLYHDWIKVYTGLSHMFCDDVCSHELLDTSFSEV